MSRRVSSPSLDFFTPAASSFRPRPYSPHIPSPSDALLPKPPIHFRRSLDSHALPPAGMDPHATDPNVLFIHPPFTAFPNSHLHSEGLTYQLMAENTEWFLDPDDFASPQNPNADAVPYPSHLEPPRGWCPAKKKDLRDRGSDGWPEGEEPRLRCTFCRRTYAGVNAKSMWRRHVFEKHKIAMSNRRDGNERPRGRGSNKENKQLTARPRHEPHDRLVNMDIAPHTDPRNVSHKSRFRSLLPSSDQPIPTKDADSPLAPSAPIISQEEFPAPAALPDETSPRHHPLSKSHIPPPSPPLTPQSPPISSDPANVLNSDIPVSTSPPPTASAVMPPSPYDPLLTPSFRHSPPRLPSDQPWRFPSPSHPLHSRSRELSLSMLVRDINSPITKGSLTIGESPRVVQASPMPSPRAFGSIIGKRDSLYLDTPNSRTKLPRPSPRALFSRGQLPVPVGDRMFDKSRLNESPLHRTSKSAAGGHKRSLTDDWLSEVSLTSSTSTHELLTGGDPFVTMYASWGTISNNGQETAQENPRSPILGPEGESPVLRNTALPTGVGLGIGLLGPFTLPEDDPLPVDTAGDFDRMLTEEEGDEIEVARFLAAPKKHPIIADPHSVTPPLKKRRMTIDVQD